MSPVLYHIVVVGSLSEDDGSVRTRGKKRGFSIGDSFDSVTGEDGKRNMKVIDSSRRG